MNCEDFNYYRAYIERLMAPGHSTCMHCNRPWKYVKGHMTKITDNESCFPLCENCWKKLETPQNREPYYKKLWLEWEAWDNDIKWDDMKDAVYAERLKDERRS